MTTGQRIKQVRKNAGLSQKQLGEKLGLSASMIGQWENDLRNPKYDTLQRIADALGVTPFELAGLEQLDLYTLARETSPERTKEIADRLWGKHLPKGPRARVDAAMDQLTQEGQEKVATYAEDLIPRYRREEAIQLTLDSTEGKDTTPPPDAPETPPEGE